MLDIYEQNNLGRLIGNGQRANAGLGMCKKCIEIDEKIDHYRWLAKQISDKRALQGIDELIQEYETQKRSLHPEKGCDQPES